LQSIINDNIKTENKFELNIPSQSSSLAAFPNSFKDEDKLPGEGDGESETETDTDISGGESASDILPEDLFQAVQNNNSSAASRSLGYTPKPKSEAKLLRKAEDEAMDIESITNK
jgi:hypothetical protein